MLEQRLICDVCKRAIDLQGGESRGQITHILIQGAQTGNPRTETKNTHLCNRCMNRLNDYFSQLTTDIQRELEQVSRISQAAQEAVKKEVEHA